MSSSQEKPLDLSALSDKYDIVGEFAAVGQNRRYPARRKDDGRDVLITVLRAAPDVAQGKAIAQFAADANLLTTLSHPSVPQVVEGRWIGEDAFAFVTDRVHGTTLAELLKAERIPNPRIADILADVDGVLTWARGERMSHRNVTPDGIWVERGSNRIFVSLSPTDAPKTNRPDPRDDAKTIGALAMTMLTAKPMADDHDGTLVNMRPDLPQRVIDATEKLAGTTINDEEPDVSAYLASLAMAEAIKEGEVEVARVEAEFRAQMKAEREKWEAEQLSCQLANEEQAKKFAEERAEYERRATKEREQLATARAEIDKRRTEVQEARAELDQARAAYKQKKSELEARAKQVDKHMSELEKQKRSLEKRAAELERRAADLEQRNRELQELAALAAAAGAAAGTGEAAAEIPDKQVGLIDRIKHVGELGRVTQPIDVVEEEEEEVVEEPRQDEIEVMQDAVEAEDEVHSWTPIETEEPWAVPLETDEPVRAIAYEAAAIPEPEKKGGKRRAWMVPAGIAGAVLLIVGAAFGIGRSGKDDVPVRPVAVATKGTATTGTATTGTGPGAVVTAPVHTDSAAGTIAATNDSMAFAAIRDSIVQADAARRERRARAAAEAAAAEERRRAQQAQTYTDSTGTVWSFTPPPPVKPDTTGAATPPATSTVIPPKSDTIVRPKPDTTVRPKPDTTGRVRPDTTAKR